MSSSKQIVAGHAWSLLEFPECREYQHKFDSELLPKIKAFKRKADKLKHISYSVWLEGCDCDTSKFTEWGYVNGIPINELNIQCDWKIKGISDKEFRRQLISDVEKMLHQASDQRHKYFREEGLGCSYDDWYNKLKKVNDYITKRVGDSTMNKYSYKGTPIVASTMKEAIQKARVIACSQNITRIRNILADVGLINRGEAFPSFEDELVKAIVANDYSGVKDKVKWLKEACGWDGICLNCFSEHGVGFLAKDILSRYHKGVPFVKKVDKAKLMEKAMLQAVHDAGVDDIGKLSDGYHTFDDLYNQRCILFAKLVEVYKDRAWKTKKHEDGEPCFGGTNFLVCIDTPQGPYSYHYPLKDWDLFKCKELPKAKHFDGHTSKDVGRILSL